MGLAPEADQRRKHKPETPVDPVALPEHAGILRCAGKVLPDTRKRYDRDLLRPAARRRGIADVVDAPRHIDRVARIITEAVCSDSAHLHIGERLFRHMQWQRRLCEVVAVVGLRNAVRPVGLSQQVIVALVLRRHRNGDHLRIAAVGRQCPQARLLLQQAVGAGIVLIRRQVNSVVPGRGRGGPCALVLNSDLHLELCGT